MRKQNKIDWWLVVILLGVLLEVFLPKASFASRYTVPKKEDVYADFSNYRDTNFSSRPYLMVGDYTDPATMERTTTGSYIKFETIPYRAQQELVKAEWHFRMMTHLGDDDVVLSINPAAHSWQENEVTGNNQPSSLSSGEYFVEASIDSSSAGWKTVDITPIVRGWLGGSIDPEKGISVQRRTTGWLVTIDRHNYPSYLTVEYRDNIGEGGGSETGPFSDSSSGHSDDGEVDEGVAERTEVLRLIFPADGEKITDQTLTFVWSERNRSYDLGKLVLVLKKENSDRVFDTEVDLNGTSYASDRRLSPGKYKWYIKGYWNDEEVFRTDSNKFEIVAGEEDGLTGEREAIAEEDTVGNSTVVNSDTSYSDTAGERTNRNDIVSVNGSEASDKNNGRGDVYVWAVAILLLLIAGLLGWIAKNKATTQKEVEEGKKKSQSKKDKRGKPNGKN